MQLYAESSRIVAKFRFVCRLIGAIRKRQANEDEEVGKVDDRRLCRLHQTCHAYELPPIECKCREMSHLLCSLIEGRLYHQSRCILP